MSKPSSSHPPRTYLGWSLAATVLCFLPLGLVAIYHGYRTAQLIDAEDEVDVIDRRSRRARRWLIATVVVGVLVDLMLAVVLVLLGAFSG